MRLKPHYLLSLPVIVSLAACGQGEATPADEAEPSERESTSAAQPRLVIASEGGVAVVDAASLETIDTFETDTRAKLGVAGDDRHVFTMEYDAGHVGVVDSGSWSVAHGDHSHHYVTEPRELDSKFERGTSYHVVSDDERSVVWFDTDGSFEVFDWKELEDDKVNAAVIETESPHHGVAAPLEDGGFIATIAEGEEAVGVAILDQDGNEKSRIETCPGLHGEAHLEGDTYAFGCGTGMLLVENGKGINIDSPREGAGSGSLVASHDSDVIVGDLYAEGDEAANTQLAFYNVTDQTSKLVDVGVEFSGPVRDEQNTVVLGTDGALHVFDESGSEVAHHEGIVDAWETFEDWEEPVPYLAVADGIAYVTDPRDSSITSFDLETGERRAKGELADVPASMVVTNAGH